MGQTSVPEIHIFVFANKVGKWTLIYNDHCFTNGWYDLTKYGLIKSEQIVAFFDMNNDFTNCHESHYTRVIVIYDVIFSKLTEQNQIWIRLGCQSYVVEFSCCIAYQWDGDNANFFFLNDLADSYYKFNTFGPSVDEKMSIVAQITGCISVKKSSRARL